MKLSIFLLSASTAAVFSINLCAAIFRCGCRSWWAGAAALCNIHSLGVRHCPWCDPTTSFWVSLTLIGGVQFLLSFWPARWSPALRLFLALAAFPACGLLLAGLRGAASGYWSR